MSGKIPNEVENTFKVSHIKTASGPKVGLWEFLILQDGKVLATGSGMISNAESIRVANDYIASRKMRPAHDWNLHADLEVLGLTPNGKPRRR